MFDDFHCSQPLTPCNTVVSLERQCLVAVNDGLLLSVFLLRQHCLNAYAIAVIFRSVFTPAMVPSVDPDFSLS